MTETYKVQAKRWKRLWELHIDGVGVTQVKKLNEAEASVRDYIAVLLDVEPDSFNVEVSPDVGSSLTRDIEVARRSLAAAESAQAEAAELNRRVAHRLRREGLSGREIALVMRVTPQRVSQLLRRPSRVHIDISWSLSPRPGNVADKTTRVDEHLR